MNEEIKNVKYSLVESVDPRLVEVLVTFTLNGEVRRHYIFLKKTSNGQARTYLKQAEEQFKNDVETGKIDSFRREIRKQKGRKKGLLIFVPISTMLALTAGGLAAWKYLTDNKGTGGGGEDDDKSTIVVECEEGLSIVDDKGNPVSTLDYKAGDKFSWTLKIDEQKEKDGYHLPHDPKFTIGDALVSREYYEYDSNTGELKFTIPEDTSGKIEIKPELSKDFASFTYHQFDNEYHTAYVGVGVEQQPLASINGTANIYVDWGDGTVDKYTDEQGGGLFSFDHGHIFSHNYHLEVGQEATISAYADGEPRQFKISLNRYETFLNPMSLGRADGYNPAHFSYNQNITALSLYSPLVDFMDFAFAGTSIKSLCIPDSILSYQKLSFKNFNGSLAYCSRLQEIKTVKTQATAPNYVVVDGVLYQINPRDNSYNLIGAQSNFSISDDTWKKISNISANAFAGHHELTKFKLPSDFNREIGSGVFADCPNLVDIEVKDNERYVSPDGHSLFDLVTPGLMPLENTSQGIVITSGSNFKTIQEKFAAEGVSYEFYDLCGCGSNINTITIYANLVSIGVDAFSDCPNLTKINYETSSVPEYIKLDSACFARCPKLSSVSLPETVNFNIFSYDGTITGHNCFKDCSSLANITIEGSGGEDNDYAIYQDRVNKMNFLIYVDDDYDRVITVFNNDKSISSISFDLPQSTKNIEFASYNIFTNASVVKSIALPINVAADSENLSLALTGCKNLEKFSVNKSNENLITSEDGRLLYQKYVVQEPYQEEPYTCKYLVYAALSGYTGDVYEIKDKISGIYPYAFSYCDSLTTIKIDALDERTTYNTGVIGQPNNYGFTFGYLLLSGWCDYIVRECPNFKYFDLTSFTDTSFFDSHFFDMGYGDVLPEETIVLVKNQEMKDLFTNEEGTSDLYNWEIQIA